MLFPDAAEAISENRKAEVQMAPRPGLEWKEADFGLQPQWISEPDWTAITTLAKRHLNLHDDTCEVAFFAEGAFNKLYRIQRESDSWLMRVALPVDPYFKTASEIATIEFVCASTDIPVPSIVAHNSCLTEENILGFEWIIMQLMPGRPLRSAWRKMDMSKKQDLVKQLAVYQSQLFARDFDQVGNLYVADVPATYKIGRMVALPFFWGDRTKLGQHGPFRNSHDWLHAQLTLIMNEKSRTLVESKDEDQIEDAQAAKAIGDDLFIALPKLFPPHETEQTVVFHDDLSMMNTLVEGEGSLTAIVDWECVSAVPLWKACQPPQLLQGRIRNDKPQRETYADASDEEDMEELKSG